MKIKEATTVINNAIEQLDNASGELYNALDNLSKLHRAHHLPPSVVQKMDKLDITLIDSIKNELEQLLEEE